MKLMMTEATETRTNQKWLETLIVLLVAAVMIAVALPFNQA